MERSLFVLLPRLPLRLWLAEETVELGADMTELGRDRECTDWYKALLDLEGALADEIDLLLRAAAIFSLNSSEPMVDGVADKASTPAWTGTCLYGTLGFASA